MGSESGLAGGRECTALVVEGLSAGYEGARNAVRNVSFEVGCGERVAVLGPNGAGKSTLFKAIVGLIPHHTGHISIHGEDCRTSHTMVGYVPQYEEIDWRFPVTVRDVVMMGKLRQLGWLRWPGRRHWDEVDEILARVGMLDFKDRQIGQLSGGQKRRVFIARALAQDVDILLLDEPFSGVDAAAEQEIMDVLEQLRQDGVTVLLATHNLGMAATEFDRLLILNGQVIAYGPPEEVFTPDVLAETFGGRVTLWHEDRQVLMLSDDACCAGEIGGAK